jgi:hypothetical protein
MTEIDSIKEKMIEELWLPFIYEYSSTFYRKRKNKKMKIFTLTNDTNHNEINRFIENDLTKKELIVGWTYSILKKIRLEAFTGCTIEGCSRFEESIFSYSTLLECLPLDIMNLDFSSQDPIFEIGRIEKEVKSVEFLIKSQNEKQTDKYILIYTTLINSNQIDKSHIIRNSSSITSNDSFFFNLSDFPDIIIEQDKKLSFLENILIQILSKYNYKLNKIDKRIYHLIDSHNLIISIIFKILWWYK